jgi:hypothetical protein
MELLGDANWWLPRWLGRILPKVHVEVPDAPALAPQPALVGADGHSGNGSVVDPAEEPAGDSAR